LHQAAGGRHHFATTEGASTGSTHGKLAGTNDERSVMLMGKSAGSCYLSALR
jgi:hypothetical protein